MQKNQIYTFESKVFRLFPTNQLLKTRKALLCYTIKHFQLQFVCLPAASNILMYFSNPTNRIFYQVNIKYRLIQYRYIIHREKEIPKIKTILLLEGLTHINTRYTFKYWFDWITFTLYLRSSLAFYSIIELYIQMYDPLYYLHWKIIIN